MKKIFSRNGVIALLFLCVVLIVSICLAGSASAASDNMPAVDNGIPVVYLYIDESQGTIEDMMTSPDHSVYCYGKLTIDVPDGFHYSDFPDLACEDFSDLDMSIRGRGNSTWNESKKPFKIKLDKKADLFGLGKNKHWVLVANAKDSTLLKDRITAWLGDEMGFDFTPRGVPVDVVMVGESFGKQYLGSYYFSENVRVDDNRLNIAELSESDTDPAVITGGYMIQNGVQVRRGSPDIFFTTRGANWATHTPSFDTEGGDSLLLGASEDDAEEAFTAAELGDAYKNNAQQKYIQDYIQHFEDVLFEEGTAYRELMDVETAAKYWLVNEISSNSDAYATGSTYLYKDRDPENGVSKLYWGPLWDFDYAWNYSPYTQGFECGHLWCKAMLYDRGEGGFVQELHKQWPVMRDALQRLIADGGVIDQYYEETKASALQDFLLSHPGQTGYDYHKEVEALKTWIRDRITWVDAHFDELDTMVHKVTYMVDGEVWRTDFLPESEPVDGSETHPEPADRTFVAWLDEQGSEIHSEIKITEDRVFTAKFVNDSEITHGKDIAFVKNSDVIHFNSFFPAAYQIQYEVLPTDADNKVVAWSSSDPNFATVDESGRVSYVGPGEVTLTAKLKYGEAKTFKLTIVEGDPPFAQAIRADQDVIEMTVGDQRPCTISTTPDPAKLRDCVYESENPKIVTVDELGALTAVAPGTTKVRIKAETLDAEGEIISLETVVTVTVSEKQITYTITPEGEISWNKASKTDLTLTVKSSEKDDTSFEHFVGVKLDGILLEKDKDYTAAKGSTVVTLKAGVLQRLSVGNHTVEVLFDNGQATAMLKVLPNGQAALGSSATVTRTGGTGLTASGNPRTGDSRSMIWVAVAAVGLVGIVAAVIGLRKKDK